MFISPDLYRVHWHTVAVAGKRQPWEKEKWREMRGRDEENFDWSCWFNGVDWLGLLLSKRAPT